MRSLYRTILVWFVVLLVLSFVLITFASPMLLLRFSGRVGPIDRTSLVFLNQARDAFRQSGPAGLRSYLDTLESQLPAQYFLLDSAHRDQVTGQDRSDLFELGSRRYLVGRSQGAMVRMYSQGGYDLVSLIRAGGPGEGGGPYLLLIAGVAATLCWLFASRLVAPVRGLAQTMERFGQGDISARSGIRRKDEIGDLARAFDTMAGRVEGLVTSERRLLQGVSHELQSPLARLAVAAKLARTASDRDAAAARIQTEIDRLSSMISGLLDITRAEGDPGSRRQDRIQLDDLLSGVVEDCEWEAREKHCAIEVHLDRTTITGDDELLRSAFENVLRNAVRYSPEGSAIDVALKSGDGTAQVTVRDHGPGVPEEDLERIFAPFYRVEGSRDAARGGTGLGLSLTQRAVLLHHGMIVARNANPGLQITLQIPVQRPGSPK